MELVVAIISLCLLAFGREGLPFVVVDNVGVMLVVGAEVAVGETSDHISWMG